MHAGVDSQVQRRCLSWPLLTCSARASYCQAVLRAVARYHNQYKATLGVLQETVVHDMLDEILSDDYTRGWTPKKDQQLNQEWLQLISCGDCRRAVMAGNANTCVYPGSMTITSGPEFYECVERGAIIISKLEDPGLDETEQVRARIPEDETSTQNVLKWMNRVLFDELKFRGNTDDYYCLHNRCYIPSHVLLLSDPRAVSPAFCPKFFAGGRASQSASQCSTCAWPGGWECACTASTCLCTLSSWQGTERAPNTGTPSSMSSGEASCSTCASLR
eukprot:759086-Hanusia_phi.AAC.2